MLRGMRGAELIAVDSEASPRVWEMVAIKAGSIRRDPDSNGAGRLDGVGWVR